MPVKKTEISTCSITMQGNSASKKLSGNILRFFYEQSDAAKGSNKKTLR
jgi:hypothetical protein